MTRKMAIERLRELTTEARKTIHGSVTVEMLEDVLLLVDKPKPDPLLLPDMPSRFHQVTIAQVDPHTSSILNATVVALIPGMTSDIQLSGVTVKPNNDIEVNLFSFRVTLT